MKTKLLLFAVILFLFSGCTTPPSTENQSDYQATIEVLSSKVEELSAQLTDSILPSYTLSPTNTPVPTSTKTPTSSPTITPTKDTSKAKAKNWVTWIESNGVLIEVERILLCDKSWENIYREEYLSANIYKDKQTFIEFVFRITNNTEQVIRFNMFETIASVNGEQIYFNDFLYDGVFFGWGGDDLDANILPGSIVRGVVWTAIDKSRWDDVNKIIISMPHAFDKNWHKLTSDFYVEIAVDDWGFEPLLDD